MHSRRFLFMAVVSLFSTALFGQVEVRGKVVGISKDSLTEAYVYVNDTAGNLLTYVRTLLGKDFSLTVSRPGTYRFRVYAVGYNALDTLLRVGQKNYFTFTLTPKSEQLDEVVLDISLAERIFKGDTIKYNLNAVRDSTERTLRDLLEKLPGVEISGNIITVNGRRVDRLLINGKNLFGKHNKVALDNIESEAVEGVEYYDRYADPMSMGPGKYASDLTALNIKIKKNFMYALMGEIQFQGGYQNKFSLYNKNYYFGSSIMFQTVANANNMGKEVFGINDYIQMQMDNGQAGKLRIPSFLFDQNRMAYKSDRFLSAYIIYEPTKKNRWKGYLILNNDSINAFSLTKHIFYDPAVQSYEEAGNRFSKSTYVDGALLNKRKWNDKFRTDFQLQFFSNEWRNKHNTVFRLQDSVNLPEKEISMKEPVDNAWINTSFQLNIETDAQSVLRLKSQWEYQKGLHVINVYGDSILQTPFFESGIFTQTSASSGNHFKQSLTYETQIARKTYLNWSFSLSYENRNNRNRLDTLDLFYEEPVSYKSFNRESEIQLYKKIGRWRFRMGLQYLFTSFFTDFAGRFDKGFWLPSFEIKFNPRFLIWQFRYERKMNFVEDKFWFRSPVATAYNHFAFYGLTPGSPKLSHEFFSYLTNKKLWWGFNVLWINRLSVSTGTPQSVTYVRDGIYIDRYFTTADISRNFFTSFQIRRSFPKSGMKFSYSGTYMLNQGILYTVQGSSAFNQSQFKHFLKGDWKVKRFPVKISASYMAGFNQMKSFDRQTLWNENRWQVSASYITRKWLAKGEITTYENRLTDAYRQPLLVNAEFRYTFNSKNELFFEIFNGLHLNRMENRKIENTPNGIVVQNFSQLPGYVTIGWRWKY